MIDLHAHLLPAIDDGARTTAQALEVIERLAIEGVTDIVCTPHLSASQIATGQHEGLIEERDRKLAALQVVTEGRPRLHAGFEIMLDEPLSAVATGDRRLALAGSRYYLIEFPNTVVAAFAAQILGRMASAGIVPIVAHPERYTACSARVIRRWRGAGARIQVDATTLTRPTLRGDRARELLAEGLVDVLAADNHGDRRSLRAAVRWLETRMDADGDAQALQLLATGNPRAVVNDEALKEVGAFKLQERLIDRARRFFRGLSES